MVVLAAAVVLVWLVAVVWRRWVLALLVLLAIVVPLLAVVVPLLAVVAPLVVSLVVVV